MSSYSVLLMRHEKVKSWENIERGKCLRMAEGFIPGNLDGSFFYAKRIQIFHQNHD